MLLTDPLFGLALAAAAVLILVYVLVRRLMQRGRRGGSVRDSLDTLADWPPEAARVLTNPERRAYEVLRQALPAHMVMAQVPLSRFVRVPSRKPYREWLQRVGYLSADLLVCDINSRVLAVIDIRPRNESERSKDRYERKARVLRGAGIHVMSWKADDLPDATQARAQFLPLVDGADPRQRSGAISRPLPLIPVAEMEELLAEGDAMAQEGDMEPVSSTLFDDLDPLPAGPSGQH